MIWRFMRLLLVFLAVVGGGRWGVGAPGQADAGGMGGGNFELVGAS